MRKAAVVAIQWFASVCERAASATAPKALPSQGWSSGYFLLLMSRISGSRYSTVLRMLASAG